MPEKSAHTSSRKSSNPKSTSAAEVPGALQDPPHLSPQYPPCTGMAGFPQRGTASWGEVSTKDGPRPLSRCFPEGRRGYK